MIGLQIQPKALYTLKLAQKKHRPFSPLPPRLVICTVLFIVNSCLPIYCVMTPTSLLKYVVFETIEVYNSVIRPPSPPPQTNISQTIHEQNYLKKHLSVFSASCM